MSKIGVIGAGAWGTALAQMFAAGGRDVTIWAREDEVVEAINTNHENSVFLKDIPLSENLKATGDLAALLDGYDAVLVVTPVQHMRATLETLKGLKGKIRTPLVLCSKGIELGTGLLTSQIVEAVLPGTPHAVLSGPTFADEVARGLPAAATVACADEALGEMLQGLFAVSGFRPYRTTDLIGTQLCGALKNVMAIASGIIHSRGMGESARCAFISRALAEISRLATAMGAQRETLLGLCGVGDLMLTCSSMRSRNFSLGAALGEGKTLEEVLGPRAAVTEGVHTVNSALELGARHDVELPITTTIRAVLREGLDINTAIQTLLARPCGEEL